MLILSISKNLVRFCNIDFIRERVHMLKFLAALIVDLIAKLLKLILNNKFLIDMGSPLLFENWILIGIVLCFESNYLMIFWSSFIAFGLNELFILFYIYRFIFILQIVPILFVVLLNHCYPWIIYILNHFAFFAHGFLCFNMVVATLSWNIRRK